MINWLTVHNWRFNRGSFGVPLFCINPMLCSMNLDSIWHLKVRKIGIPYTPITWPLLCELITLIFPLIRLGPHCSPAPPTAVDSVGHRPRQAWQAFPSQPRREKVSILVGKISHIWGEPAWENQCTVPNKKPLPFNQFWSHSFLTLPNSLAVSIHGSPIYWLCFVKNVPANLRIPHWMELAI